MADIFDLFKQIAKKEETVKAPITHIIAGLGNPGEKYKMTRHNAGFLTIDHLAEKLGVRIDRAKFHALYAEATLAGKRVLLLKPQTLMNASGLAVQEAASFYKIAPENILVISDDIAQDVGRMRLRRKGSAGGQNGLKDIITCLGTDAFPRLRMGVGAKPHPDFNLADWVLSDFRPEEQKKLFGAIAASVAGIEKYLSGDFDGAMQICNSYHTEENTGADT
jgi:PTH1 family peptidyl-tRNA hydrolase